MNNLLHSLLLAVLFLFTLKGQGQYAIAGVPGQAYVNIVPDTLINYVYTHNAPAYTESYFFDINGDFQNDIELRSYSNNALGAGDDYIQIRALNVNTFIRFGRLDSVYHSWSWQYWWVSKIAQPMLYGDTINSVNSVWDNTLLYITDNSFNSGANKNILDWISPIDKFIGVKYISGSSEFYGWIKAFCPDRYRCYLKEYSTILMPVNIEERATFQPIIFPNPANDKIHIGQNSSIQKVNEVVLINSYGAEYKLSLNDKDEIDVSELVEGVYFLQIKTGEGIGMKKIVVQR